MHKRIAAARRMFMLSALPLLGACTQMPTENQGVTDIRPQISFRIERDELAPATIRVNGRDMGAAASYINGQAGLRLIPGSHHLQVIAGGRIVLDERFYVGDGVNKSFILK